MLDLVTAARVLDCDEGHCQLAWRNIYICNTIARATSENISSLAAHFDAFAARTFERPIAFLLLTQASTSPPAASDRKRFTDVLAKHGSRIGGVGIGLAAEGFAGAVLRSVASAVFLLPRTRYEVRFFSKSSDAATWVARIGGCSASEVTQLIQLSNQEIATRRAT